MVKLSEILRSVKASETRNRDLLETFAVQKLEKALVKSESRVRAPIVECDALTHAPNL